MGNIRDNGSPYYCMACDASHPGLSCREYMSMINPAEPSKGEKSVRLPAVGNAIVVVVEPNGVRLNFTASSGRGCSISLSNFINSGAFDGSVKQAIADWGDDRMREVYGEET